MSSLQKEGSLYTSVGAVREKLCLGTNDGVISFYHLATLQYLREEFYPKDLREAYELEKLPTVQKPKLKSWESSNKLKSNVRNKGPTVNIMCTGGNSKFLIPRNN